MDTPHQARPSPSRNRTFSFKSIRSDKSDPTRPRPEVSDLTETPNERRKSKFTLLTSRDPNKAIREAQPADRQDEARTIPTVRSTQWKDWRGDVITDPDTSNPSRPRMERPLDTIRSFEAAIDSEWKRKTNLPQSESADWTQYSSRRNSYVAGNETPYGNRHSTPVGALGNAPRNPHRYNDHYAVRPSNARYQSSPMAPQAHGWASHPAHGYSQSYDTVDTGGSHGTSGSEPWANSTDPSSENSSIERAYNMNGHKGDHGDQYGGQYRRESPWNDPIQEEYGYDGYDYTQGQWNGPASAPPPPPRHSGQYGSSRPMGQSSGPPPVPQHYQQQQQQSQPPPPSQYQRRQQHQQQQQRQPIPLGGGSGGYRNGAPPPPPKHAAPAQRQMLRKESTTGGSKRKSWLRRRFSKD